MANSKKKGNRNELQLTKWWEQWTDMEFSRVPQSGGLRWKDMEAISGDIICTDPVKDRRFPFTIETKFYKDINFEHLILGNKNQKIVQFWDQAMADGVRSNKVPLLFFRYNGMTKNTWFVMISYELYKLALPYGMKHQEYTSFRIKMIGYKEVVVINSNDLLNVQFKAFKKQLKIKLRHGNKY